MRDGVAAVEQGTTIIEVLLSATQADQIWLDRSQHDSYHVPKSDCVARGNRHCRRDGQQEQGDATLPIQEETCGFWSPSLLL
jgi:hypothetical protein